MPIDIESERLVPLREVPSILPGRVHISSVYRWIGRQNQRLESIRIGGRRYTSREALSRFVRVCSGEPPNVETTADAARRHARAEAELDAAGC